MQRLKLDLPEENGYTTIAGFLMDFAGRVLNMGVRVQRTDGMRISRVRFTPVRKTDNRISQTI